MEGLAVLTSKFLCSEFKQPIEIPTLNPRCRVENFTDREFCNSYCESVVDEEVVTFPTQVWQDWWSNRVYARGPKHFDPLKYPFIAIPMNVQSNHWIRIAPIAYFPYNKNNNSENRK